MLTFDDEAVAWDDQPGRRERAHRSARLILDAIGDTEVRDVLEIGAGTGLLSLALAEAAPAPWTFALTDTSDGMLAVAQQKIDDAGLPWTTGLLDLSTADPATLTASYDLAIAHMVLHHVDDIPAMLRGIRAVLRPGGVFVGHDLNHAGVAFHNPRPGEPHWLSEEHLRAACSEAGFGTVTYSEPVTTIAHGVDGGELECPMSLLAAWVD